MYFLYDYTREHGFDLTFFSFCYFLLYGPIYPIVYNGIDRPAFYLEPIVLAVVFIATAKWFCNCSLSLRPADCVVKPRRCAASPAFYALSAALMKTDHFTKPLRGGYTCIIVLCLSLERVVHYAGSRKTPSRRFFLLHSCMFYARGRFFLLVYWLVFMEGHGPYARI
jgi:hypothetical protein